MQVRVGSLSDQADAGEVRPSSKVLTVDELMDLYLDGIDADGRLSAKTRFDYRSSTASYVRPLLGSRNVRDLTPEVIIGELVWLRRPSVDLDARRLRVVDSAHESWAPGRPAQRRAGPGQPRRGRYPHGRRRRRPGRGRGGAAVVAGAADPGRGLLGLRWGEMAALTADRIDAGRRQILVDRQVIEGRRGLALTPPKNRRRRTTMYPAATPEGVELSALLALRLAELSPEDLVFPSARGNWPRRPDGRRT